MSTANVKRAADARADESGAQPTIGQAGIANTLKSLDLANRFQTDSRKINELMLTVDQEAGGSSPPSCTNDLSSSCWRPVGNSVGNPGFMPCSFPCGERS